GLGVVVKKDPRDQCVELKPKFIGMLLGNLQKPLAATDAPAGARADRCITYAVGIRLHEPPIIRIGLGLNDPQQSLERTVLVSNRFFSRSFDHIHELIIPQSFHAKWPLRGQPTGKTMTRQIQAKKILKPAIDGSMPAIFHALEIFVHVGRLPRWVAGKFRDMSPVFVMRIDEDQGIMRGTTAQGSSPRIKNAIAVAVELDVALLLFVVGVMPYEEIPLQRRVFRREGVKGGNLVVAG